MERISDFRHEMRVQFWRISSVIRQLFRQCFMGLMKRAPSMERR